ncbi:MAG TPA: hypothetical protein VN648_05205, partial [Candidatus Methylomirabilis sp.]|nr:hypothetical protein [Candidatus Methylomirabilis sp.]
MDTQADCGRPLTGHHGLDRPAPVSDKSGIARPDAGLFPHGVLWSLTTAMSKSVATIAQVRGR